MILFLSVVLSFLSLGGYVLLDRQHATVHFPDPHLEAVIRLSLDQPEGSLSKSQLATITHLEAPHAGIRDLTGMNHLVGITSLNLAGNRVTDVSPLSRLRVLKSLDLTDNAMVHLEEIGFARLSKLPHLKELNLAHNVRRHADGSSERLQDISLLRAFTNLNDLCLSDNHISDISHLKPLSRLQRLDLSENPFHDASALQDMKMLESLNLRQTGIEDITMLGALHRLKYLNLHSTPARSPFEPLGKLVNLKTLILRNVSIGDDTSFLRELSSLRRLNLRGTGIRDVSDLAAAMTAGGLMENRMAGVETELDIRDNLIPTTIFGEPSGHDALLPFWSRITHTYPVYFPQSPSQEVRFNEIMTSNGGGIRDESGDRRDWLELHNPGRVAVDLSGYHLSDDPENPFKWTFPEGIRIEPEDYLIVWASGKNGTEGDGTTHTNFRLSASGETLLMMAPDRQRLVDKIVLPSLVRDASWQRFNDAEWLAGPNPSPGEPNVAVLQAGVQFSHEGGRYEEAFSLLLSSPLAGTEIYYTLDGSEPDPLRPVRSWQAWDGETNTFRDFTSVTHKYTVPLRIQPRGEEDNVYANITTVNAASMDDQYWRGPDHPVRKATVVRAVLHQEGQSGATSTRIYQVESPEVQAHSLPVLYLTVDPAWLFDYETGLYVAGKTYDELADPELGWRPHPANYHTNWEYPAHAAWISPDNQTMTEQQTGLRIHGGWSRALPLKGLRLYARNRYDNQPSFFGSLLGEVREFPAKTLLLRLGQSLHATLFEDALWQSHAVGALKVDLSPSIPVVHYINGEYWGILNAMERFDKHFLQNRYGVDPDNLVILGGPLGYAEQLEEGAEGDNLPYRDMLSHVSGHDMSQPAHYAYVETLMDMDSFIDYNLLRIYSGDDDGANKHIHVWRVKTGYDPDAPYGHDGRWRWQTWDIDYAMESWQRDTLSFYANDDPEKHKNPVYTELLVRLLQNETFRNRFLNRFADLINTLWAPDVLISAIDEWEASLLPEIEAHIARWKIPQDMTYWASRVDQARTFARHRPERQRQQVLDYFNTRGISLPGLFVLSLSMDPDSGPVRINTIDAMVATRWEGTYFQGVPLTIKVELAAGVKLTGWKTETGQWHPSGWDGTTTLLLYEDTTLTPVYNIIP